MPEVSHEPRFHLALLATAKSGGRCPRSRQALICGTCSCPAPSKNGGMPIRDIRISCEKRWNSNVFRTFPFAFRGGLVVLLERCGNISPVIGDARNVVRHSDGASRSRPGQCGLAVSTQTAVSVSRRRATVPLLSEGWNRDWASCEFDAGERIRSKAFHGMPDGMAALFR